MKLLIIGHGRHGKDTTAEIIKEKFGLTFQSSSMAAAEIFIYDELKEKYGYRSFEECYNDRHNHRAEWHDLICGYNKDDKARLAKAILEKDDIYVGMRSDAEVQACIEDGLFDWIIGVYDPRKDEEPKDSFNIDMWKTADFIIPNGGDLTDLENKVYVVMAHLYRFKAEPSQFNKILK
jgi:hypothetical protein